MPSEASAKEACRDAGRLADPPRRRKRPEAAGPPGVAVSGQKSRALVATVAVTAVFTALLADVGVDLHRQGVEAALDVGHVLAVQAASATTHVGVLATDLGQDHQAAVGRRTVECAAGDGGADLAAKEVLAL